MYFLRWHPQVQIDLHVGQSRVHEAPVVHAKPLHMKISHLCTIATCILQGKSRHSNIETNMSSILRVCTSSLHLRLFSFKKQEDSTWSASEKLLQMVYQMQKKNHKIKLLFQWYCYSPNYKRCNCILEK